MAQVHFFLLLDRVTLKVEHAAVWSDGNPTVDRERLFPIKYCSWSGETHQEAYDKAKDWLRNELRSELRVLPEAIAKMALGFGYALSHP